MQYSNRVFSIYPSPTWIIAWELERLADITARSKILSVESIVKNEIIRKPCWLASGKGVKRPSSGK